MKRYDIIRRLIDKRGYRSYLEIGVLGNETFNSLPTLEIKHSVDPNGQAVYNMTSDEFFANYCSQGYDIVFIDGLHLAEQVTKDIENALTHLNKGGIIVMHDCLPTEEWQQLRQGLPGKPWTGDVWRAFADLRASRQDLSMYTVDTDWGCGVIERGSQMTIERPVEGWTWEYFLKHKQQIMNIVTVEEFCGRIQ